MMTTVQRSSPLLALLLLVSTTTLCSAASQRTWDAYTTQDVALPCVPAGLAREGETCALPDCRCSTTDTPGGLEITEIPQLVVISFDDAITVSNHPFYVDLSKNKNPNDCPITLTFFASHDYTDYTLANDLHHRGHEVAVHSVTHKADIEHYWRNMTIDMWKAEMNDMRTMLGLYGNIPAEDIKGFRAPFLEVGGNDMYTALKDSGFTYDCSWPSLKYTPWFDEEGIPKGALWPYTLDYHTVQDETVGTKPTESIPGMWVAPMTDLLDNTGVECAMLDTCRSEDEELDTSSAAVLDLLKRNFKSHYYTKRTPFGVYVHYSWFLHDDYTNSTARRDGFSDFLDYLTALPEVYIVSINQLVEWVKDPHSMDDLDKFEPFQCGALGPDTCLETKNCLYKEGLPNDLNEIYMKICGNKCPTTYPYLGNVNGE